MLPEEKKISITVWPLLCPSITPTWWSQRQSCSLGNKESVQCICTGSKQVSDGESRGQGPTGGNGKPGRRERFLVERCWSREATLGPWTIQVEGVGGFLGAGVGLCRAIWQQGRAHAAPLAGRRVHHPPLGLALPPPYTRVETAKSDLGSRRRRRRRRILLLRTVHLFQSCFVIRRIKNRKER